MIRVESPSRLHFGLLSVTAEKTWPSLEEHATLPARQFGGVGLMVRQPGVRLSVEPAADWSADGPLAERALAFARQFTQSLPPSSVQPHRIQVEAAAPEHAGLGTGTQLGLAVAHALALSLGQAELDALELARRIGRGQRSAIGTHGFARGGFLVEGGKKDPEGVSPLIARVDFPEKWRIVLVLPPAGPGRHGQDESQAFARLMQQNVPLDLTDTLSRLVLLGLLPALAEQDLQAFGEALYDFNVLVGEVFALVQGGRYATPASAEMVSFIRQQGIRGVGQSSWGPALFAVTADEEQAADLSRKLRGRFHLAADAVFETSANNHGALVETLGEDGMPAAVAAPMAEVIPESAPEPMPFSSSAVQASAAPFAPAESSYPFSGTAESASRESSATTVAEPPDAITSTLPAWQRQAREEEEEEAAPRLRREAPPPRKWGRIIGLVIGGLLHLTAFGVLIYFLVFREQGNPPDGKQPPPDKVRKK